MGTEVLDCVLDILGLLEAVGCGHLIIEINLLLVEDESVASSHHVTLIVDQVAAPVHQTAILVVKLAVCSLQDDKVAIGVGLELTQDLLNVEVRQFSHTPSRQSLSLSLGLAAGHLRLVEWRFWWEHRVAVLSARVVLGVWVRATALHKKVIVGSVLIIIHI